MWTRGGRTRSSLCWVLSCAIGHPPYLLHAISTLLTCCCQCLSASDPAFHVPEPARLRSELHPATTLPKASLPTAQRAGPNRPPDYAVRSCESSPLQQPIGAGHRRDFGAQGAPPPGAKRFQAGSGVAGTEKTRVHPRPLQPVWTRVPQV